MAQIGNTITPPGGYGPQATQNQSMADALAKITGSAQPATAAYDLASQGTPNYQSTNIPQLNDMEQKMQAMFASDQNLAQKYANPSFYGGGAQTPDPTAGNPAGFAASPLMGNPSADFAGFTDPSAIATMAGADASGQNKLLNMINNAVSFTGQRTQASYADMLDALKTLSNQESDMAKQKESEAAAKALEEEQLSAEYGYVPGQTSGYSINPAAVTDAYANDLAKKNGVTLSSNSIQKAAQIRWLTATSPTLQSKTATDFKSAYGYDIWQSPASQWTSKETKSQGGIPGLLAGTGFGKSDQYTFTNKNNGAIVQFNAGDTIPLYNPETGETANGVVGSDPYKTALQKGWILGFQAQP